MIRFPDDTQVRIMGLNETLAELYAEGKKANEATVEEIITKLEAKKNYIPSSDRVRKEFTYVLLKEYRGYIACRAGDSQD